MAYLFGPAILTASELQELGYASKGKVAQNGLNEVAHRWLEPLGIKAVKNEYLKAGAQISALAGKLHEALDKGSSMGHSRLIGDLRTLEGFESIRLSLVALKDASEQLARTRKEDRAHLGPIVRETLLALLLMEYYGSGGSQALPSNGYDAPSDFTNEQFAFVRAFTRIVLAKALATFSSKDEMMKDHLLFLGDLDQLNDTVLVQDLRKAKDLALSLAVSKHGYLIDNGRISLAAYDPLLDDDIDDYFSYEMERLTKDLP
jgi:hypothetical protein